MDSKNWVDCHFNSAVAAKVGLPGALVFSRVFWSIENHYINQEQKYFRYDRWWMFDSAASLKRKFDFLSLRTIQRALEKLENFGLIRVDHFNADPADRTNWYSINFEVYNEIISPKANLGITSDATTTKCRNPLRQNDVTHYDKMTQSSSSNMSLTQKSSSEASVPVDNFGEKDRQDEGGEREERAVNSFEKNFRTMTASERDKFLINLKLRPELSLVEIERNIVYLKSNPLLEITTQSPNRIFYMEESEKWLADAYRELKDIAQSPKIRILGQFSMEKWEEMIRNSNVVKRCHFAPQEILFKELYQITFGTKRREQREEQVIEQVLENDNEEDEETLKWREELQKMDEYWNQAG